MKTRFAPFYALVLTLVLFSSCQKEDVVEPITPSYTYDDAIDQRSSEEAEFEMWQQVDILQPNCDNEPIKETDGEGDDETTKTSGCYGSYGLTSYEGSGWILEYGRFTSTVELIFDADNNKVSGTIDLLFPSERDMLVLHAVGSISKISDSEDGTTLNVQIVSQRGTGRFKNASFKGTLHIMEADQIFDGDATDYYATLFITGAFTR